VRWRARALHLVAECGGGEHELVDRVVEHQLPIFQVEVALDTRVDEALEGVADLLLLAATSCCERRPPGGGA
jgi:hypothetical protein